MRANLAAIDFTSDLADLGHGSNLNLKFLVKRNLRKCLALARPRPRISPERFHSSVKSPRKHLEAVLSQRSKTVARQRG